MNHKSTQLEIPNRFSQCWTYSRMWCSQMLSPATGLPRSKSDCYEIGHTTTR